MIIIDGELIIAGLIIGALVLGYFFMMVEESIDQGTLK